MSKEPTAVLLAAEIIKWLIPKVGQFPRHVRFGLGMRLEQAHIMCFEQLLYAQYSHGRDRLRALGQANLDLQVGRHLGRLAFELGHFTRREALHLAAMQVDLGKQVGGWRKSLENMVSSSADSVIQNT